MQQIGFCYKLAAKQSNNKDEFNKIQSLANEITIITNNLPSGYFRDFQILKESFFPSFEELKGCLDISAFILDKLIINTSILDDEKYKYLFTVEEVNKEVLAGTPFREAYAKISKAIQDGIYKSAKEIHHTHEGSIGNLCNDKITEKMNAILTEFNFELAENALKKLLA